MRRNWWIYIVASLVIIAIVVFACQNETASTANRVAEQKDQIKKDSILKNILIGIDTLQIEVRSIGGKCDSAITIMHAEIKRDSTMKEEIDQLKIKVRKCQKQSKK